MCCADDDNDAVLDATDNCPLIRNADQKDNDRDGKGVCGARCDPASWPACREGAQSASPAWVCVVARCVWFAGNLCDPDDDNDGVPDARDNCPLKANPTQANRDRDAFGA